MSPVPLEKYRATMSFVDTRIRKPKPLALHFHVNYIETLPKTNFKIFFSRLKQNTEDSKQQ